MRLHTEIRTQCTRMYGPAEERGGKEREGGDEERKEGE